MSKILQYIKSESTFMGLIFGATFYLAYGISQTALANYHLVIISLFLSAFMPFFSRISNYKTSIITVGRIGRFIFQLIFNLCLFGALSFYQVLKETIHLAPWTFLKVTMLTTLLSQGSQYIAISFANREFGNKTTNIIIALVTTTTITALSFAGLPFFNSVFIFFSTVVGGGLFIVGLISDLRSQFYPKGGIGIFMGTFNPIHKTHLRLIQEAIQNRNLDRVYIHPTVIPKLHRDALKSGKIIIAKRDLGMRVYSTTNKSDIHVNYFPTGNKFFEFNTRCLLAEISLSDTQLHSKVTVLRLPEIYEATGFYGIISHIHKLHPNQPIHGIHGSDLGGMWVRSIYDESGWIYPYAVRRVDSISATAIRNGVRNQTTPIIEKILEHFRNNAKEFIIGNRKFDFQEGELKYETISS